MREPNPLYHYGVPPPIYRKSTCMPSLLRAAILAIVLAIAPSVTGAQSTDFASGPSVVEAPLGDTLEVRPAEGWRFADCSALLGASELVTSCSAESFTVTGGAYDSAILPARVPVRLLNGSRELTVDYVIRLAEPERAAAPDTTIGFPLPAGSVILVPLSSLGLTCGLCSAGTASIQVGAVTPKTLGTARVTGSHLVYTANARAQGPVEVDLKVRDDINAGSKTFKVRLHITKPSEPNGARQLHGMHLVHDPGPLDLTATDLVASTGTEPNTELIISACGPAMHGTVRCTPGGEIHYEPAANAPATDQFAVRLVAGDGGQTIASVTLREDAPPLASGAGTKRAKLELTLPTPPPEVEEAASGATTRFTELMDALGAQ